MVWAIFCQEGERKGDDEVDSEESTVTTQNRIFEGANGSGKSNTIIKKKFSKLTDICKAKPK